MKVEFEFIIFNDGKPYPDWTNDGDSTMRDQINAMCKNLGIKCIDMDNYKRAKKIQNAAVVNENTTGEIAVLQATVEQLKQDILEIGLLLRDLGSITPDIAEVFNPGCFS